MGSNQSTRATHFHRHEAGKAMEDVSEDHHINISNKMVERLVEDAAITNDAGASSLNAKGDYKEKIFIEKLRCMDDKHTERCGLTVEELNALVTRLEMRTSHISKEDPICEDLKDKIIDCYDMTAPSDIVKCWNIVGAFTQCVQDASSKRLEARSAREARATAQRTRRVARARAHLASHDDLTDD
ncbi:uncharacterized protein LOC125064258 [Vanessa atalanta]|uniref:uncharacterized protein LOC125064258 n=1 Tax=Vanessa atalanta TaxID=42275 RepID=UPI001FCDE98F|nr:uncharacterized protein LOC125064258 [Vanessa atalanta]